MRNTIAMRAMGLALACVVATGASNAAEPTIADSQLDTFEAMLDAHPDHFAGLTVDPERRQIVVRRVGAYNAKQMRDMLAKAKLHPAAEDDRLWSVVTTPVTRSSRNLNALRKQLLTVEPFASLLRPVLARFHIDVERNVVAVGVTAIGDELFDESKRVFGDAVELYIAEHLRPFSRTNWINTGFVAAGTRIIVQTSLGAGPCTSGFSVRPNDTSSIRGFLTAGHCLFSVQNFSAVTDSAGNFIAPSFVWHWGDFFTPGFSSSLWTPGSDAALLVDRLPGQTFIAHPSVYTTNTFRRFVVGTRSPRVGDVVCFSGALTGENCTARIRSVGLSAVDTFPSDFPVFALITDLVEAESTNGTNIAQPGDSGGPVYVRTSIGFNTVVRAVGAIQGGPVKAPTTVAFFQPMSKVMPSGWRVWAANCTLNLVGGLSCSIE